MLVFLYSTKNVMEHFKKKKGRFIKLLITIRGVHRYSNRIRFVFVFDQTNSYPLIFWGYGIKVSVCSTFTPKQITYRSINI